jgi:hypothetical protein
MFITEAKTNIGGRIDAWVVRDPLCEINCHNQPLREILDAIEKLWGLSPDTD